MPGLSNVDSGSVESEIVGLELAVGIRANPSNQRHPRSMVRTQMLLIIAE